MTLETLRARMAAYTSWAHTQDRTARTAPARAAAEARFEREVDPDGLLPPDVRQSMAEAARRAYYARLALRSAQARARSREVRERAVELRTRSAEARGERAAARAVRATTEPQEASGATAPKKGAKAATATTAGARAGRRGSPDAV